MTNEKKKISKQTLFLYVNVFYVVMIVVANVMATKVISVGSLIIDAGTLTYPLTFWLGDMMTEVFGYKSAKRVILIGFAANLLFCICAFVGTLVPPLDSADELAIGYDLLFTYNFRILFASFVAYICGALLNAKSFTWIQKATGKRLLAVRTIGSTLLGAAVDTIIFTAVAWIGQMSLRDMAVMALSGYAMKMIYETVIATPLAYLFMPLIKRRVEE